MQYNTILHRLGKDIETIALAPTTNPYKSFFMLKLNMSDKEDEVAVELELDESGSKSTDVKKATEATEREKHWGLAGKDALKERVNWWNVQRVLDGERSTPPVGAILYKPDGVSSDIWGESSGQCLAVAEKKKNDKNDRGYGLFGATVAAPFWKGLKPRLTLKCTFDPQIAITRSVRQIS